MSANIITKIDSALNELEEALIRAKSALRDVDTDDSMLAVRIESYENILKRQRSLVRQLSDAFEQNDWSEVARLGELVRGSSLLIKVDAGFILNWLKNPESINNTEEYQA